MSSDPVLQITKLSKHFGGIAAVDNLTIPALHRGRMLGIVGPNGAGKTTLFNILSGFARPDAGSVILKRDGVPGRELTKLPPHLIARAGLGRLFQDMRVFDRLTCRENILAAFNNQPGENPARAVFSRAAWKRTENENAEETVRQLAIVGLSEKINEPAENLSYGQQKLLAIARLLASGAEVLLLDEPVAGVHVDMAETLRHLICRLADDGRLIIVIEHRMEWLLDLLEPRRDHILRLDAGRLDWFGTAAEAKSADWLMEEHK